MQKDKVKSFYAIVEALFMYIGFLILPSVVGVIGKSISGQGKTVDQFFQDSGVFYNLVSYILLIVFFRYLCKREGITLAEKVTIRKEELKPRKTIGVFFFGACMALAISAVLTVIPFPDFLINSYEAASSEVLKNADWVIAILAMVVFTPFVEEVIFRGYIFNRLLRGEISEHTTILLTSFLFAILHAGILWKLYAFFVGCFFAYIALKEDNLAYSIVMHSGFNFISIPTIYINTHPNLRAVIFGNKLIVAMYGIIAVMSLVLMYRVYQRVVSKS